MVSMSVKIMAANKQSRWKNEEILSLIAIWGDSKVQAELDGVVRNKSVYQTISKKLRENGYNKDWKQLYKKAKTHHNKTGQGRKAFKYFAQLNDVMGNRAAVSPPLLIESSQPGDSEPQSDDDDDYDDDDYNNDDDVVSSLEGATTPMLNDEEEESTDQTQDNIEELNGSSSSSTNTSEVSKSFITEKTRTIQTKQENIKLSKGNTGNYGTIYIISEEVRRKVSKI